MWLCGMPSRLGWGFPAVKGLLFRTLGLQSNWTLDQDCQQLPLG